MKILVACECSGVVTRAFRDRGHDAWSCDIQETKGELPEYHIKSDVTEVLTSDWDMIIAFPPCTHICVSGAKHFTQKRIDGRQQSGIDFFLLFTNLSTKKVIIENPVGIMSTIYRKPDQIIQPYQFGHNASKKTCLWLKGVDCLVPTKFIPPDKYINGLPRWRNQSPSGADKMPPSTHRSDLRSKTYSGIAKAMADQWGKNVR